MGFLDDLKKRMSTSGAERYSEERFREAQPQLASEEPAAQTSDVTPPLLVDVEAEARRRRRRLFWSITVLVGVLLVAGGTVWGVRAYRAAHTVAQRLISLRVEAPEKALSGNDVQIKIAVANDSRVTWNNVVVEAELPDGLTVKNASPKPASTTGTVRWAIGTLRPRESSALSLVGRLVGEEGTSPTVTATVILTPENVPGVELKKSQFAAVRIDAVPLDVAVEAPKQAASGEQVTVRVAYQNRTAADLTDVRVLLTPPPGFVVQSTDPVVAGRDLVWNLSTVPQQGQGILTVVGFIEGEPEAVRPFRAAIGFISQDGKFLAQRQVQATTTIARRALTVSQTFNNERDFLKVDPGADIQARVLFKNTGDVGLRDIIVKLVFEGRGLDAATVETQGGFFDSQTNTITWTAASSAALKTLRPGESGELAFRFRTPTVSGLPLTGPADKNFSLVSKVTADSPDIPAPVGAPKEIVSDRFEIFVNSVLSLDLAALYDDGRAGLPVGKGPVQPQVGQESVYTVRVRANNTSNDVVDAIYRTVLPEGLRWTNDKYTTVGSVAYNERTREVRWNIGAVPARAGTALPSPEFSFQVGLTPSLHQVGEKAALTKGHTFDGTDVFTAARLHAEGPALTTEDVDPRRAEVLR